MTEAATLQARIQVLTEQLTSLKTEMETIKNQTPFQVATVPTMPALRPNITMANQINTEIFKCLPTFSGTESDYNPWRNQVWTQMENIKQFINSPEYYNCVCIIRAKIIGAASRVLSVNGTELNFYAIINRLDYTYSDKRPLYVLKDGLSRIRQGHKTLTEFHDEIHQALTLIQQKIETMEDNMRAGRLSDANNDAIRVFIMGLRSNYTKGILYANNPKSLGEAYAIACTIYHDNQDTHFENAPIRRQEHRNEQRHYQKNEYRQLKPSYQVQQRHNNYPTPQRNLPEPMDVDNSTHYRRPTNFQQQQAKWSNNNPSRNNATHHNPFRTNNQIPEKRAGNHSSYNYNANKVQRINQTQDEDLQSIQPQHSNDDFETGSVFLGE